MVNVYDYSYQLLYDAAIECCNKLVGFEYKKLIVFLTTDNTEIEKVFKEYESIPINHRYLKKIMMLTLVSCAYLVCEYKLSLEIDEEEITEVLKSIEGLTYKEIISMYEQNDSDLKKLYDYYAEYANGTYIYRFNCWQNLFREDKIKTILKLNPFVTLSINDMFIEKIFPETEFTIELLYTFYNQALYKAEIDPEYNENDYNYFNKLVVEYFYDLTFHYFNGDKSQIDAFYSMIIGIVYENIAIIKEEKNQRKFSLLLNELENTPLKDLIAKFYNNSEFALQIIDLFIEFNDFLEVGDLVNRRINFLKLNKNTKLKKFNPYFDEDEKTLKRMKEKSAIN